MYSDIDRCFDNRCLRDIPPAIRKRVFVCATGTFIEECVQPQKLRWLGHVLCMPNHRLPKGWLTLDLADATRLPGWGPHCAWLETLQDMAAKRCQWRSCCQCLSRLPE
ncbi:hypothetical protein CSKR_103185 [Clonorchis sinensis]|uniref:Uncharacterized protein n=1 Tax=Clonorchis sinensis TaxID=79923 RepID=A0A3R7JLZ1_CLOSI|nr:hypothetical protein CSKR_103185 [Clonorchis sinensis]